MEEGFYIDTRPSINHIASISPIESLLKLYWFGFSTPVSFQLGLITRTVTLLYNPIILSLKVLNALLALSLTVLERGLLVPIIKFAPDLWSTFTHFFLFRYIHFLLSRLPGPLQSGGLCRVGPSGPYLV